MRACQSVPIWCKLWIILDKTTKRSPTGVDKYCTLRGKQPRSIDKVSNFILSAKGSELPRTTWRWAWKQPSVKKRVTTYKLRDFAPEIQETKNDTEAVISSCDLKGSRTFCIVKTQVGKIWKKRSEVRMLTWVTKKMENESIWPKAQRFRIEEKIETG